MIPALAALEAEHDQSPSDSSVPAPLLLATAAPATSIAPIVAAVPHPSSSVSSQPSQQQLPPQPPAQSVGIGASLSFIPSQDRQSAIQEFQQRLVLLHHASKCEHSDELSLGKCRVSPFCRDMRCLWDHANACSSQSCAFPHCISTRFLLAHFYKCEDADCVICKPLKDSIKRIHKRTRNIVRVASRRSDYESDESPMTSPRDALSPRDSISPRDYFLSPRSDPRVSPREHPGMIRDPYYHREGAPSAIDPKRNIPRVNVPPIPIKVEADPTAYSALPGHYSAAATYSAAAPAAPPSGHFSAHIPPLQLHQPHLRASFTPPLSDSNRHGVPPISLHSMAAVVASDGESTDANADDFVASKYMRPVHHEDRRVATEEQIVSRNSVDSLTTALESFTDDFSEDSKSVALSCGRCSVAITCGYRYHCAVCQINFCATCFHCEGNGQPHEHPVRAFIV